MKIVIIAGGSGTRLWPLSRQTFPKQFLKLYKNKSLLRQTAERFEPIVAYENILVVANDKYKFYIKSDLNFIAESNIILEPVGKNTAPAIFLAVKYCMEKLRCSDNEVIFISPSDHVIKPEEKFREYIKIAEKLAQQNMIVTFGIKPTKPETGYGYIKVRSQGGEFRSQESEVRSEKIGYFEVDKFVEKPDFKTAEKYLTEGNYYWNSGMFAFNIKTILEEFKKYSPEIFKMYDKNYDELLSCFNDMPEISIDYAIAEKSERVITLPVDLYWNDIGSWDSLYEIFDKDENGNVKSGDVMSIDTKESFIMSNKKLISTIGIENCIIVETADAILISKKGQSQKVKNIFDNLKKDNRKEIFEHVTTYRPWGNYTILEEGNKYKIKRIAVNPYAKLSLQKHQHRSEHWVVVTGIAKVTIGEKEIIIKKNESVYVPKNTLHRLENPDKNELLEIIEVQNGDYVGEDDIIRVEDVYGRP